MGMTKCGASGVCHRHCFCEQNIPVNNWVVGKGLEEDWVHSLLLRCTKMSFVYVEQMKTKALPNKCCCFANSKQIKPQTHPYDSSAGGGHHPGTCKLWMETAYFSMCFDTRSVCKHCKHRMEQVKGLADVTNE